MTMETNLLLDTYLKQLRLPAFAHNYGKFAEDAAQANLSYDRYLLALAGAGSGPTGREPPGAPHQSGSFPVLKELADFDFSCVPSLSKQRVLELARAATWTRRSRSPGGQSRLGKSHVAIGLALAACRQGHRVRFYNAAGLVNELIQAQDEHQLPRLLANALKQRLIVLDELGFIPLSPTAPS